MSDFYRQQSSQNNDDYNHFKDEKLPWERDERPKQENNPSMKYLNYPERPCVNEPFQNASNKSWETFSNPAPASAFQFDAMPLPRKCKWIEKTPYPVLESKGGNYFLLVFGILWTLPFVLIFYFMVRSGEWIEILSSMDWDQWVVMIFPVVGITASVVGIHQAFKRTWITNKGEFIEVERGFTRKGQVIPFCTQTSVMNYASNTRVNNQPIYQVTLEDRSSGQSVVISDGLRIHQVHEVLNFMQYHFKVR